jgi:hypothetical protein
MSKSLNRMRDERIKALIKHCRRITGRASLERLMRLSSATI